MRLPWCSYPKAADPGSFGLQVLPDVISMADFGSIASFRSPESRVVSLSSLEPSKVLETAKTIARSFSLREPMGRHLRLPKNPPGGLMSLVHRDPFGSAEFGPWLPENVIYWLLRLFVLTDPTSSSGDIRRNDEVLAQSFALLGASDEVHGGVLNETMPHADEPPAFREGDLFLATTLACYGSVFELLGEQEEKALNALSGTYPAFKDALENGLVGHLFFVARDDNLTSEGAFELVASTMEHYQRNGFKFVATEATNQWTGAAFEAFGGVPVYFSPYQARLCVQKSETPVENGVSSPNGFLSDKDSGCMFYVLCLND